MISRFNGYSFIHLLLFMGYFLPGHGSLEEKLTNISLRLYLGKTVDVNFFDVLVGDAVKLLDKIDLGKPTILYIHGFSENINSDSVRLIVDAYIKRQDHNVLATDYGEIAGRDYVYSATNTPGVGQVLGKALSEMVAISLDPTTLYVVGHSLGGQVAGYIGRNVDFKLQKIIALDPAGPGFRMLISHLKSGDAEFVQMIHTDSGFYGIGLESGDGNFYPNNGRRIQPGCPYQFRIGSNEDFCSHHRSWIFYAESISNEKAFIGIECTSNKKFKMNMCKNNKKVIMGFATPNNTRGKFYLETNKDSPYGREEEGVIPI